MYNKNEVKVVIDVWGPFACFTHPACKVERDSYPIITPSAARGILCSIYMKPIEFYYEIEKIEIMNDIKYINVLKNESKEKINYNNPKPIHMKVDTSDEKNKNKGRTQRNTCYLKNVYYRIHAKLVKRSDYHGTIEALYKQFERRVRKGQCFQQPYLGLKECVCYFSEPNLEKVPNEDINLEINPMLYDVFDITKNEKFDSRKKKQNVINISFFDANVVNGVCEVPPFHSDKIRRVKNV